MTYKRTAICLSAFLMFIVYPGNSSASEPADETLLVFVGENVEMISLVSKKEENAWESPGVVDVITAKEIRSSGALRLGQLLSRIPGFCTAKKERGYSPYLRGIRDSILFLYDTVPLGLAADKSYNPLGYDLALSSIERIEIVRGPGSVLWGPDAFAGIVNIVPKTGNDLQGIESGIFDMGGFSLNGAYLNAGKKHGEWSSFASLDAKQGRLDDRLCNVSRFWGEEGTTPVDVSQRYTTSIPDVSSFIDLNFRLNHQKDFSIMTRYADASTSYSMSDVNHLYAWRETRNSPSWIIKSEGAVPLDKEKKFRLTGYLSSTSVDYEIIDKELQYEESTAFLEGVLDQACFDSAGLVTMGLSFREKDLSDVPVWTSYVPEYLVEENTTWLPKVELQDIQDSLVSMFGQYRHTLGRLDVSAGARWDFSSLYSNSFSINAGAAWNPEKHWCFKTTVGTAYRTPFVVQMREGDIAEPEKVTSLNLQGIWKPDKTSILSLTVFYNNIENHILESVYSGNGITTPNTQDIYGIEMSVEVSPLKNVSLSSCLTLMSNSGASEIFLDDYTFFYGGKGTIIEDYTELAYDYDTGPKTVFNGTVTWAITKDASIYADVNYTSPRKLYLLSEQRTISCPETWIVNTGILLRDVIRQGVDLEMGIQNLLNNTGSIPGTYSLIENDPIQATIVLKTTW